MYLIKMVVAALLGLPLFSNAPVPASAPPGQAIMPGGCVVHVVEIEGTLGYYGNAWGRLPNGALVTTTRWYPWEGYFVDAGGKRYVLDLPVGDEKAERLKGKKVRVSGRLVCLQAGRPGKSFLMPFIQGTRLKAAGTTLGERTSLAWRPSGLSASSSPERFLLAPRNRLG